VKPLGRVSDIHAAGDEHSYDAITASGRDSSREYEPVWPHAHSPFLAAANANLRPLKRWRFKASCARRSEFSS
jgi:hypothetical protein